MGGRSIYYQIDISPTVLTAFRKKFFIILNLAVGGNWPGYPDTSTVFPQTMVVDYVRVYQDSTQSPSSMILPGGQRAREFYLGQNYPNPFNPSTAIYYRLPESSYVQLRIYDMLGREVKTIVDGEKSAGEHTMAFESGSLPSGVYLYRLETVHSSMVRKMVLVK